MITKEFIDKQKAVIEKKIESLASMVQKNKKYEDAGSADEDNAQEFEEFEGKTALDRGAETEMENLKKALRRIKEGTYGRCRICNEPIETSRLLAYPEADLCATHAKESSS